MLTNTMLRRCFNSLLMSKVQAAPSPIPVFSTIAISKVGEKIRSENGTIKNTMRCSGKDKYQAVSLLNEISIDINMEQSRT